MKIRIGTNEVGGTFHSQGAALAKMLETRTDIGEIELVPVESASVGNAEALGRGKIEFGFMASNWIGRAMRGEAPFTAPIALRMASPANAGPMFFVVRADSGMRAIDDMRGRRVVIGPQDSGMVQHVHNIFGTLGIAFDALEPINMNFGDGADALAAGKVDVQWQCPVPNKVMTDLANACDVRVLEYGPGQLEAVLADHEFYRRAVLPADAFRGLSGDTDQVGVLNIVATHERVDAGLVRDVVAAMVAHADDLAAALPLYRGLGGLYEPLRTDGAKALEPGGAGLHPGAAEAYRAAGLLAG
jgi:TRAP transporter TAXI family solute receptor